MTILSKFLFFASFSCLAIFQSQSQAVNRGGRTEYPVLKVESDQVEVIGPVGPVLLGEETKLLLSFKKAPPQTIYFSQSETIPALQSERIIPEADQALAVSKDESGWYVSLTPSRLGRLDITLSGHFADGGVFIKKVIIYAQPSGRIPKKLLIYSAGYLHDVSTMRMLSLDRPDATGIVTEAFYDKPDVSFLVDSRFVQYTIIAGDKGAVRLDAENGRIRPIHPGEAVLQASFGGARTSVCLMVTDNEGSLTSASHPGCKGLLRPGEHLGPN